MDVPLDTMFMIRAPSAATGSRTPLLANVTTASIERGASRVLMRVTG